MLVIDDFTHLTPAQSDALLNLLQNSTITVFPAGKYGELELKHSILKHYNSSTSKIRYEVIDQSFFKKGFFGDINKVICTLSISNGQLKVKLRQPGKERIVKMQLHGTKDDAAAIPYSLPMGKEEVSTAREGPYSLQIPHLHAKPIVNTAKHNFIVMRHLPGKTLTEFFSRNLLVHEKFELSIAILEAYKTQITPTDFVHCDLNPNNLLVHYHNNQFEVFIIDFGMTHHKNSLLTAFRSTFFTATKTDSTKQPETASESLDVLSLGLNLALLWGYPLDNFSLHQKELSSLLSDLILKNIPTDLPDYDNHELLKLIQSMTADEQEQRPSVEEALDKLYSLEANFNTTPNCTIL